MAKIKMDIEGMSCQNCAKHVKEALSGVADTKNVEVDLANKCAVFESTATEEALRRAVEEEGYDVIGMSVV